MYPIPNIVESSQKRSLSESREWILAVNNQGKALTEVTNLIRKVQQLFKCVWQGLTLGGDTNCMVQTSSCILYMYMQMMMSS